MKKLYLILVILLVSCNNNYQFINQEIIYGKVSAKQEGTSGRFATRPKIWVQDPFQTRQVDIPYEYENKWNIGDSCLLIIERYSVIEEE